MTYADKMRELFDELTYHYEKNHNNEILSKTKLAEMLYVDKSYISKIFNGKIKLTLDMACKLAKIYEVPKEVLTLEMNIRDIPPINKDGLVDKRRKV